jgi:hypothetical protein
MEQCSKTILIRAPLKNRKGGVFSFRGALISMTFDPSTEVADPKDNRMVYWNGWKKYCQSIPR